MYLFPSFKIRKALILQSKGKIDEAENIYLQLLNHNVRSARYLLAYSVLLIKKYEFKQAKRIILLAEKCADITEEQKKQVYINYAICLFKLGEPEKAIALLEKEHARKTSGFLQQTLGYLYIENQEFDKAYNFILESLDYDSEDAIVLDNMAQYYYRKNSPDKLKAKEYFQKAIEIRPTQIDSLYFLSLYDMEDKHYQEALKKLELALKGDFSPLNFAQKDNILKLIEECQSKL